MPEWYVESGLCVGINIGLEGDAVFVLCALALLATRRQCGVSKRFSRAILLYVTTVLLPTAHEWGELLLSLSRYHYACRPLTTCNIWALIFISYRAYDTRLYHEFGKDYILREVQYKESTYDALKKVCYAVEEINPNSTCCAPNKRWGHFFMIDHDCLKDLLKF